MKRFRDSRALLLWAALIVSQLPWACSSSREAELERAVESVAAILERAGRDYGAFVAYQSSLETGGTVITYVMSGLPPGDNVLNNLKLEAGRPSQAWSVVIRSGAAAGDYLIEGYGTASDKPLHTKMVSIRPVPSP